MKSIVLIFISLVIATGCATTRGIVDLSGPDRAKPANSTATNGTSIYVAKIEDNRVFELEPNRPSIPSLKDGQITNVEITSRAIARKRNSYGMAMGDVLLPEGRTVSDVVRENLVAVLTDQGYRVVESPTPDALPLEVSIRKFWSWFTPGFWAAKIEFTAELALSGPLSGLDGEQAVVEGYAHQRHQGTTNGAWLQTMEVGLQDLRNNLSDTLERSEGQGARYSFSF
ncbi:MAG: hypothetical protein ACODAC_10940 [Pseudomonadota bacterium]